MFVKLLYSERGMGIIQVLAALLIVTVSVSGLFISSYYARYKADAHYHYRVALLKAAQKLEEIKCINMFNQGPLDISNIPHNDFIIDDKGNENIMGSMSISKRTFSDPAVATYISYDVITVEVKWKNGPNKYFRKLINAQQQLELREDYFYRTDILLGG
jgi:hypothetical protein